MNNHGLCGTTDTRGNLLLDHDNSSSPKVNTNAQTCWWNQSSSANYNVVEELATISFKSLEKSPPTRATGKVQVKSQGTYFSGHTPGQQNGE